MHQTINYPGQRLCIGNGINKQVGIQLRFTKNLNSLNNKIVCEIKPYTKIIGFQVNYKTNR